jgi:hypothetical protein
MTILSDVQVMLLLPHNLSVYNAVITDGSDLLSMPLRWSHVEISWRSFQEFRSNILVIRKVPLQIWLIIETDSSPNNNNNDSKNNNNQNKYKFHWNKETRKHIQM